MPIEEGNSFKYAAAMLNKEFRPALAVACPACGAEPLQKCRHIYDQGEFGFDSTREVRSDEVMETTLHVIRCMLYFGMLGKQTKSRSGHD